MNRRARAVLLHGARALRNLVHGGGKVALAWLCLLLLTGAGELALSRLGAGQGQVPPQHGGGASGWGGEALRTGLWAERPQAELTVFPVANACGLGASSCFKCHNGSRAPLPRSDAKAGLWHAQHQSVNYSCAGCHQGNPRILKKEIAHQDLVADPLQSPDKSCSTCHSTSETQAYLDQYKKVKGE